MASRAFVSDVERCKYLIIKKKTVELSRLFFPGHQILITLI